jgi:hypothetical protein
MKRHTPSVINQEGSLNFQPQLMRRGRGSVAARPSARKPRDWEAVAAWLSRRAEGRSDQAIHFIGNISCRNITTAREQVGAGKSLDLHVPNFEGEPKYLCLV